jgi:hypothetical protein
MTRHHDRVRAVLLVHRLEADRRARSGEGIDTDLVVDLTARIGRIQARHDGFRARVAGDRGGDGPDPGGPDADGWLVALYDAALAELCGALGVRHSLVEQGVCSDEERQRVELELLSSVLPLAPQ